MKTILGILIFCAAILNARSGPQFRSIRALSMGNAHVAVSDDKEAIYYNVAGLNQMNKLGNYEVRPDLGYYPEDYLDMQVNFGLLAPNLLGIGSDAWDFYQNHKGTFKNLDKEVTQSISDDSTLFEDALFLDRHGLTLGAQFSAELAFKNFGGAIWSDVYAIPYIDAGIIVPSAGYYEAVSHVVGQIATAYEVHPQWSVGVGYRMIKTIRAPGREIHIANYETISDTVDAELSRIEKELSDISFDHAIDLGVMFQAKRELRFGASMQNIFLNGYQGESATPELTVGMNYSPRSLNHNTAYARKVNFALDFENILNSDKNYKTFSKVNFGFEVDQVILSYPSLGWAGNLRLLSTHLAAGFKGGYWSAGLGVELLRVFRIDFASWAEEGGYYTGQEELRYFLIQTSMGF